MSCYVFMQGQQDCCGWRTQESQEEQSCQPCNSRHHSPSTLPETLSGADWPDQSPADPQSPTTPTPGWLNGHRQEPTPVIVVMTDKQPFLYHFKKPKDPIFDLMSMNAWGWGMYLGGGGCKQTISGLYMKKLLKSKLFFAKEFTAGV